MMMIMKLSVSYERTCDRSKYIHIIEGIDLMDGKTLLMYLIAQEGDTFKLS